MSKTGAKGVVAAGHRLTAQAAADVLREGGNAFDASIAALAMSSVCESVLSSPGGGGFAMMRDGSSGEVSLLDFFPHTPLSRVVSDDVGAFEVHADFGPTTQAFHVGPAMAATPGFFPGLQKMHRLGASMPMADLVAPAVAQGREGVEITPFQHYLSTVVRPIISATPEAEALFTPGGDLIPIGGRLFHHDLASAFESFAADPAANAEIEAAMLSLQDGRGHLTKADLDAYETIKREPLSVRFDHASVHMNPLPAASGVLISHTLANLESNDPVEIAAALTETDLARQSAGPDLAALLPAPLRQKGTTHVSVIDSSGTAVSVTVSNGEGNGELVDGCGFMLNNILGEEDVNPSGITGWPTNTRLSSMMCPTIIEEDDGSIVALGSGGSNRIRSAIAQVVNHLCHERTDLATAVQAPRLHVEGGYLNFEDFYTPNTRAALTTAFGEHRAWDERNLFFGGVHAVQLTADGKFLGQGDPRRDGTAIVV